MPASLLDDLRQALDQPPGDDLAALATELLAVLGYRSQRRLAYPPADGPGFLREFPARVPGARAELAFADAATSVQILFQLTDAEIAAKTRQSMFASDDGSAADGLDDSGFDAAGFDAGNARSFLFVAVELAGDAYPRGHYAAFTREINKRIQAPTVVLFRTAAAGLPSPSSIAAPTATTPIGM